MLSQEHFQAKWTPVGVMKMLENSNPQPRFESIKSEKALAPQAVSRWSTIWTRLQSAFFAGDGGERVVMRNRLALACMAFVVAGVAQQDDGEARAFFQAGLPILLFYLFGSAALLAHIVWRPETSAPRLTLAFAMDCLTISSAMVQGGGAAAYLFPLYLWLILGAGARLGGVFLGLSVGFAAFGFTFVVASAPFWRGHAALAASLLLSIVVLPLYGAILLRHVAAARAEAERANRAKTLFLASVSHELRTPLTAILGLSGLLEKTSLDAEQRDMTRTLSESAQSLLRQIESLLGAARDEIGASAPALESVDLFALLASMRAMLAVEAEAKGVRLALMIEVGTPRFIHADPRQLLDIIQNVAGNAVKFTASGAVAIRVGARRGMDALWLDVDIRDTGMGVDPAAHARIFQPFSQGDPSIRAKFGGAGLGLAIVQRQLEALGGEVTLRNSPGEGAAFLLRWPVTALPDAAVETDEAPACPAALPADGSQSLEPAWLRVTESFDWIALARGHALIGLACGDDPEQIAGARSIAAQLAALRRAARAADAPLTILLAEDNAVNGRVLERILANRGHRVRVVGDGEAALALMLSEAFDIVLLDMNMPRLGGVEAARIYTSANICATPPRRRAPIIALTADDSAERRALCAEAGMVACLGKPIQPEALVAAMEAARSAPEPPQPPDTESLDAATLSALLRLGGRDFLSDLVVQFAGDGAHLVENLDSCLSRGDVASLRRAAHALESCAGNLGAFNLVRLCRSWRALNADQLDVCAARESVRLHQEWNATQRALGRALAA
jgi:two-component system sensor histidine kinase RpfC